MLRLSSMVLSASEARSETLSANVSLVDNLFWRAPDDVCVEDLQQRQSQLLGLQRALRSTLSVLRGNAEALEQSVRVNEVEQATTAWTVESEAVAEPGAYFAWMEDELSMVMGELMQVAAEVNELNVLNHRVSTAVAADSMRVSRAHSAEHVEEAEAVP